MKHFLIASIVVVVAALAGPAAAQVPDTPAVTIPPVAPAAEAAKPRRFIVDVAHDYKNYFSWNTGLSLGAGGLAAYAVHPIDDNAQQSVQQGNAPNLRFGDTYGAQSVQMPLAIAVWAIGHVAGSDEAASTGRDMLRAQISVLSWNTLYKYAANRSRPNGDPRGLPSGHAANTFAMATVLEQHYGWKIGVPAFAAAVYTAASRVTENQHWVSDVVFGAVVGIVSGRTVTVHVRETRVAFAPLVLPGGGGVMVNLLRKSE